MASKVELLKSILGLSGHVTIQSQLGQHGRLRSRYGADRQVPGVVRAAPVVDGQVMASQNNANLGVIVRGIRARDLAKLSVAQKLRARIAALFRGDDAVIVGSGLAARLGVRVGGEITLIAPKGNVTPFGTTPRVKTYHVIQLFASATRCTTTTTSSCRWKSAFTGRASAPWCARWRCRPTCPSPADQAGHDVSAATG